MTEKRKMVPPEKMLEETLSMNLHPDQKWVQSPNGFASLPRKQHAPLQRLVAAHIQSFDWMAHEGLALGIKYLRPMDFEFPNQDRLTLKITGVKLSQPGLLDEMGLKKRTLYPSECRMRGTTYKGRLEVEFELLFNGKSKGCWSEKVGDIPIMVKSSLCNLADLTPEGLVRKFEDSEEMGGYFISNGNERVIRFLTAQRRNYPLGIERKSWKEAGQLFSEYGISIRCVRADQMSANMVLHYLTNGTAKLKVHYERQPVFLPLIMVLKALVDWSDEKIYNTMIRGKEQDSYYKSCVKNMMRLLQDEQIFSTAQVKQYIGERFRVKLPNIPSYYTDEEVTDILITESIAIHLDDYTDKFNLIVLMTKKLFSLARSQCAIENPDNPMFHEISLSGHIYFTLLLERLSMFLTSINVLLKKSYYGIDQAASQVVGATSKAKMSKTILQTSGDVESKLRRFIQIKAPDIVRPLYHLLSTGNLLSKTTIGLSQIAGLSVMADKINFWRFISHFRAVHRGQFFAQMRTTACRKLYPEAWGFLCPVHTPDGAPCGLLNHLSELCLITNNQPSTRHVIELLQSLGMLTVSSIAQSDISGVYDVLLDGRVIGQLPDDLIEGVVRTLRQFKCNKQVPTDLEVGFVKRSLKATQYPGLFLFSSPSRMVRPVYNLQFAAVEMIGTFEQPYLSIAVSPNEIDLSDTTHQELRETCILSVLAAQVPYPDFNQSPRNMYACQMGKQTMGTPSHTLKYRNDNKMYSIVTPQSPLVRPQAHDQYHFDEFPYGTNAVVAVISYTGYDMEDAMILNKSSVERGFKDGSIFKTMIINLRESTGVAGKEIIAQFGRKEVDANLEDKIDTDGLPFVGSRLEFGTPLYSYVNIETGLHKTVYYKSTETAYVWNIKLLGSDSGKDILQKVSITLYVPRRPTIGDKFANRHGQKGVCSVRWPQEDMPFTESGITPDIIFNPHGYPSRMTIGMMIESLAGKVAAANGVVHDATPFTFSEDYVASDHYGELLEKAGFNYFGTEKMFSGVDGRMLEAEIFIGLIYYIRLRHMVGDKYQVRSVGNVDYLTKQPIKGRKRGGGIRFGEMERDSLLAHGTAYLLHDRLFQNSDKSTGFICVKCSSILSPYCVDTHPQLGDEGDKSDTKQKFGFRRPPQTLPINEQTWKCKLCNSSSGIRIISIPFVLRYLIAELASVNINVQLAAS